MTEPQTTPLVAELRRRMAAAGFSQKALARAAGLNETAVRDILIGKSRHPRHDTVQKLAAALGCSAGELIDPSSAASGGEQRAAPGRPQPATGAGGRPARSPEGRKPEAGPFDDELVFVPTYGVSAAAGEGIVIDVEHETGRLAFRRDWLRTVTSAGVDQLAVITVRGDSMHPTLADGDTILVDLSQRAPARDGVYIIRFGEFLLVKRLSIDPVRRLVIVSCDNENYPPLAPVAPEDIDVAGRVIWVGRRI